MLTAQVARCSLPGVDARLPARPEVVQLVLDGQATQIGRYGGTLRSALLGNGDYNAPLRLVGNQGLLRWTPDFSAVVPNLAQSFEMSSDAREFTFHLREGVRWSDGTPFTADDILFSMNDVAKNTAIYRRIHPAFEIAGKSVDVSRIDDYTVRFRFAGPYIGFPEELATPAVQHPTLWQKKYCSQFLPTYNSAIDDLVRNEHFKNWADLFRARCGDIESAERWRNPARPTLDPWIITSGYDAAAQDVRLERNPYFWQVDSAGNQLPYIDHIHFKVHPDPESIVLAAVRGELDFQTRFVSSVMNRPVLAENQAHGYRLIYMENTTANAGGLWFNQTSRNQALLPLLRNRTFREALSIATDRKGINDKVFLGQGTPAQIGPMKRSRWYNEQLATQHMEFDVARANQLLDHLGLNKRDTDGIRLLPSGERLLLHAIVLKGNDDLQNIANLVSKQWGEVGVQVDVLPLTRAIYYDKVNRGEYDLAVDVVPGGLDTTFNPRAWVALHPTDSFMSTDWSKYWLSNGRQGTAPSASMQKRQQLYEEWMMAKSKDDADEDFREILQEAANEFEIIGTTRRPADTAVVSQRLRNVYPNMPAAWVYATPGPSLLQQWFFAE